MFVVLIFSLEIYGQLEIASVSSTSIPINKSSLGLSLDSYFSIIGDPLDSIVNNNGLSLNQSTVDTSQIESPSIVGDALVYPNPFNFREDSPQIGYRLNTAMTIDLRIYTVTGYLVGQKVCQANDIGGEAGYNYVNILDITNNTYLPAGSYLYLVIHENTVLDKDVLAVQP